MCLIIERQIGCDVALAICSEHSASMYDSETSWSAEVSPVPSQRASGHLKFDAGYLSGVNKRM